MPTPICEIVGAVDRRRLTTGIDTLSRREQRVRARKLAAALEHQSEIDERVQAIAQSQLLLSRGNGALAVPARADEVVACFRHQPFCRTQAAPKTETVRQ